MSSISACQPALGDLLALPRRRARRAAPRRPATGSSRSVGEAALFAELRERIAAPGGLEQVRAEQRVVARGSGGTSAERLRVVRDDGARRRTPRTTCPRRRAVAAIRAPPRRSPADRDGKAPGGALGEQRALGRLAAGRAATYSSSPSSSASRAMSAGAAARTRAVSLHLGRRRAGAAELGVAERLLQAPQRVAQLVARGTPRAGASGRARARPRRAMSKSTRRSRCTVARLLRHARVLGVLDAGSVCAWGR